MTEPASKPTTETPASPTGTPDTTADPSLRPRAETHSSTPALDAYLPPLSEVRGGTAAAAPVNAEEESRSARRLKGSSRPEGTSRAGTAMQTAAKAIGHIRTILPYAQRIIPLLEGNILGALAPMPSSGQSQSALEIDTSELERSVQEVSTGHRELRGQLQENSLQLRKVQDQLERVREATDRNTLEQTELVDDMRKSATVIKALCIVIVVLLLAVAGVEAYILMHMKHSG